MAPDKPLQEAMQTAFARPLRGRCRLPPSGDSLQLDGLPAAAAVGGLDAIGFEGAGDLAPAEPLVAELGDSRPHGLVVVGLAPAPGADGRLPVFGGEAPGARAGCVVGHWLAGLADFDVQAADEQVEGCFDARQSFCRVGAQAVEITSEAGVDAPAEGQQGHADGKGR